MKKVLFISLYNIRNQMAAAILKQLSGQKFEVYSAWVLSDEFSPLIIGAMNEIGVDVTKVKAQKFSKLSEVDFFFDCAVILCEDSNIDKCPIIQKAKKRIYWEVENPLPDASEEKLQRIRRIRDKIKSRIEHWLNESD